MSCMNMQLLEQTTSFAKSASKASVFVVSAHRIISDIFNHPEELGLSNSSGSGGSPCGVVGRQQVSDHNDSDIHLSSAAH
jgi:hypothetical protein